GFIAVLSIVGLLTALSAAGAADLPRKEPPPPVAAAPIGKPNMAHLVGSDGFANHRALSFQAACRSHPPRLAGTAQMLCNVPRSTVRLAPRCTQREAVSATGRRKSRDV